jgi:phenylpyruvate tautomerase PptA (4-oxalocrotonate tautomerase family)
MPLVQISLVTGRSATDKASIADAIHRALVSALKIPESDRNIRINEYKETDFQRPPGKSSQYVLIEITQFQGRTKEAKRNLYQAIIQGLSRLQIEPSDVFIVLHELPMENWGIRGGIPADEVDLGFNTKI